MICKGDAIAFDTEVQKMKSPYCDTDINGVSYYSPPGFMSFLPFVLDSCLCSSGLITFFSFDILTLLSHL